MAVRSRAFNRMTGLLVRWGLIKHPYGREYVREHYTLSGRRVSESSRAGDVGAREALLAASVLLLLGLLTTGILLG